MANRDHLRWLALIVVGQVLYTAGASLTSGTFLLYYVRQWASSGGVIAWFLILPEIVHIVALSTAYFVHRFGSSKRVWLYGAILARGFSASIAAAGFLDADANQPDAVIPFLFVVLALSECFRAISYAAFLTWISSLFGKPSLGRLFGYRESAIVIVSIALPPVAAVFREWLATHPRVSQASAYSTLFLLADAIVVIGLIVLARIPERSATVAQAVDADVKRSTLLDSVRTWWRDRAVRRVFITSVHLAAAQGLTQSVLFKYQVDVLGLPLTTKTMLQTLMYLVQFPLAIGVGHWLDRFDNRYVYAVGLAAVSAAMPFLFFAEANPIWIAGAYACWGAFAIVNVSGRSLLLRLVEPVDVPTAVTVFRFGAGLVAGATGLLGGYWLDAALGGKFLIVVLGPYWTIIAVSALGRVTAPIWLLGWDDKRTLPKEHHIPVDIDSTSLPVDGRSTDGVADRL